MKDWATDFYHSKTWLHARKFYISKRITIDGGLCERCKKNLGKIVHHKIYLTSNNIKDEKITLSSDNLEFLCQKCHNLEHIARVKRDIFCLFNEDGDLLPPPISE